MPRNPSRRSQGGDVEGFDKTDVEGSVSDSIDVAAASFDPGYELGESLGYASEADLKRGFCTYGKGIGDPEKR